MSSPVADRFVLARSVADVVLYEGYLLYPYRASSGKNQVRWQFGVLSPRAFSEADGSERWWARTECIVSSSGRATVAVRVRCLQVQHRSVEARDERGAHVPVERLEVDGQVVAAWDEAVEQTVDLPPISLVAHDTVVLEHQFDLPPGAEVEPIVSTEGRVLGRTVRRRERVAGRIRVVAHPVDDARSLTKVAVTVENAGGWNAVVTRRSDVLADCLLVVHTMLAVDRGVFLSQLDPPADASAIVGSCRSEGAFPVLVGPADDVILSSPIVLYDHPEVAAESPGDLYDATEIDEILALRVLTLTEEEKAEARGTDARAAAIIDRCEGLSPERWERLHGTIRPLREWSLANTESTDPTFGVAEDDLADGIADEIADEDSRGSDKAVAWWDPDVDASVDPWSDALNVAGVEVRKGSPVRLWPSRRSDAQDVFLKGLCATVAGVFKDVDGGEQVAVTVDDDPATAELAWQGRYLFFHPDEIEPLRATGEAS